MKRVEINNQIYLVISDKLVMDTKNVYVLNEQNFLIKVADVTDMFNIQKQDLNGELYDLDVINRRREIENLINKKNKQAAEIEKKILTLHKELGSLEYSIDQLELEYARL